MSTIRAGCEGVSIVEETGSKGAGKFGRIFVNASVSTRQMFIDAYTVAPSPNHRMLPSMAVVPENWLPLSLY